MKTPSLYAEITAAGIPTGSHASDLYFPDTPESRAILNRHPTQRKNAKTFANQAPPNVGERWIDVPFAFEPFWDDAQRQCDAWAKAAAQAGLTIDDIKAQCPT